MAQRNTSLLLSLYEHHFFAMQQELELQKNGVIFHHVVDHDEFVKYIHPYQHNFENPNELQEDEHLNYKSDELFSLDNIFRNNERRAILFKEYYFELENFKNIIKEESNTAIRNFDYLYKYVNDFTENGTLERRNQNHLYRILDTKSKNLIAFCMGSITGSLEKYSGVISSKGIVSEEEFLWNFAEINNLDDLFSDYNPNDYKLTSICNIFFKRNENRDYLNNLEKKAKESSQERDAKVIHKIDFLNSKLFDEYISKKMPKLHIFLYVSSTQNSEYIYNQSRFGASLQAKALNGERHSILRNTGQIFLSLLCAKTKDPIAILGELKEICLSLKTSENKDTEIDNILRDKLSYAREELENFTILSNFENYRKTIADTIDFLDKQNSLNQNSPLTFVPLLRTLTELLEMGSDEVTNTKKSLATFENVDFWIRFRSAVNEAIDILKKDIKATYILPVGKDNIRGKFNILPILYFYKNDNFQDIAYLISTFLTGNIDFDGEHYRIFLEKTIKKYLSTVEPSLEEKLLRALILIIIPTESNDTKNNEIALKSIIHILENEINNSNAFTELKSDYNYFIVWLSRRMGYTEITEKYIEDSIKNFSDDPRFFHGKSLLNYCYFNDEKNSKYLLIAIQEAEKAIRLYKKIDQTNLVKNIIGSLYNSIAYYYIELFEADVHKNNNFLVSATKNLLDLKLTIERNFNNFPEYLHTEAHLELLASRQKISEFVNEKDPKAKLSIQDNVIEKLEKASNVIKSAIDLFSKHEEAYRIAKYNNLSKDILNELRTAKSLI